MKAPGSSSLGLRDFLFYIVPGGTVLLGMGHLLNVSAVSVTELNGISESIAVLVIAYAAGQLAHGVCR